MVSFREEKEGNLWEKKRSLREKERNLIRSPISISSLINHILGLIKWDWRRESKVLERENEESKEKRGKVGKVSFGHHLESKILFGKMIQAHFKKLWGILIYFDEILNYIN